MLIFFALINKKMLSSKVTIIYIEVLIYQLDTKTKYFS